MHHCFWLSCFRAMRAVMWLAESVFINHHTLWSIVTFTQPFCTLHCCTYTSQNSRCAERCPHSLCAQDLQLSTSVIGPSDCVCMQKFNLNFSATSLVSSHFRTFKVVRLLYCSHTLLSWLVCFPLWVLFVFFWAWMKCVLWWLKAIKLASFGERNTWIQKVYTCISLFNDNKRCMHITSWYVVSLYCLLDWKTYGVSSAARTKKDVIYHKP